MYNTLADAIGRAWLARRVAHAINQHTLLYFEQVHEFGFRIFTPPRHSNAASARYRSAAPKSLT
jgi:hypothetical protein